MAFTSGCRCTAFWLGLVLCLTALAQPTALHAQSAEAAVVPRQAPTVTVVIPEVAEMRGQVAISGTLVAREEVLVYPNVSGFSIDQISVDVGDQVTRGQELAKLNDASLKAQLAQADAEYRRAAAAVRQAESQIESAKASQRQTDTSLERSQSLRESGDISQAALDRALATAQSARATAASAIDGLAVANAQLQQADASRAIARLNLSYTKITAPVSGLISERNAKVGAIATSGGDPVFRVIRNGEVELEAEVVETALGQISLDDPVELAVSGIGPATGKIRRISPTVDARSRLGTLRIAVETDAHLRPGTFASGWVVTELRDALTVPSTAVLNDSSGSFLLTVNDGVVSRVAVVPGLIWQDRREIVSGLSGDESVIARAGAFFRDGDLVNAVAPATPEASQ